MFKRVLLGLCILTTTSGEALVSFKSADEVINDGVEFIECAFIYINSNLKSVTIPSNQLHYAIKNGMKFDSSSVPGCSAINDSDMHLTLDLEACIYLPKVMRKLKTIMVMCDIGLSETETYEGCTRTLLKKQCDKLNSMGLRLNVGSELEFFALDKNKKCVDSDGYFDSSTDIATENVKQHVLDTLVKAGIEVEKIHHEVAPGQYEVTFRYGNSIQSADTIIFTKYIIRSMAKKYGLSATFMPKPIAGVNGSGMHIHYSLYDEANKCNIFYSESSPTNLSDKAQSFLAGNLKHMLEISSLLNSCVNSYKRLVPGYEAPVYLCWGIKNRSALIRIPLINKCQKSAVRAEIRCPDAECNPYLAFAAITASGIKGIQDKLVVPNPISGNLYKLTEDQIKSIGIHSLPASLEEAVTYLNNSLFAENFLGKRLLNEFTKVKMAEVRSFKNRNLNTKEISNWELKKYL
jgi:glutamine synthetase